MHRTFYEHLATTYITSNNSFYQILLTDPLTKHVLKINQILDILLSKKLYKKIKQLISPSIAPKTPNLYFLPKLHKSPNITGRPICSANNHPAENISLFLDHILKEYAIQHPLYLRDGPQLLETLNKINEIPKHAILFSIDVINMYPSIPITELIDSIFKTTTTNPIPLTKHKLSPETVRILLKTVLFTNHFTFNNIIYKQTNGVAMGTPCAYTITDIFICNFVTQYFFNWTFQPRFYRQYRDDSFGIWLHGEENLKNYLLYLNNLHKDIKFTLSYGKTIQYLDLNISISPWGTISTETYYKPSDTFQYLEANSNHPISIIKNIPKSQILRHMRNCSSASSLLSHTSILAFNLKKRSFTHSLIMNSLPSLLRKTRTSILAKRKEKHKNRTPLIITFNSNVNNLQKILTNNTPEILHSNPPLLAYRI